MDVNALSETERELVECLAEGRTLTCSALSPTDLADAENPTHVIRGEVIREVLLGRLGNVRDPRGLLIRGARILGELDLDGIASDLGIALMACWLDKVTARGASLPWLDLSGTALLALSADRLQVGGDVLLRNFTATGAGEDGAVRLRDATIGGLLDGTDASLTNPDGPALVADRLRVGGDVLLRDLIARGANALGVVRLPDVEIGGQLLCGGASLSNSAGPALYADRLKVTGGMFLRDGFTAAGTGGDGAVRLSGAEIGGQFTCGGASLSNSDGPALYADRLKVVGGVFLRDGFKATGTGERGAVRLLEAEIGGQLDCSGASLANPGGPALGADRLQVGDVLLRDGFTAAGTGERGAIRLVQAKVGLLDIRSGRCHNGDGPALDVRSTSAAIVRWPTTAICRGGSPDSPDTWVPDGQLRLEDFTYGSLSPEGAPPHQWLTWISHHTLDYTSQPYQQLANVHRAEGQDTEARRVLIAQQKDALGRGTITGRWSRLRHRMSGLLIGYGYRPWRAVAALGLVVLLSCALGLAAGHYQVAPGRYAATPVMTTQPLTDGVTQTGGGACSTIEQLGVGLERGLPVITTRIRDRCDFDTKSRAGQWFTAGGWVLQAIAWALATVAVGAYTGLIRKPT